MLTLDKVLIGDKVIIKEINTNLELKNKLLNYGIIPNTIIECVLSSMGKDPYAYLVRESIIALRKQDTKNILVEKYNG